MEKSHVKTFYNNLADEVDQHFARALQSATTPMQSQSGPSGGDTACWAHQPLGQQPYLTDVGTAYPPSPSLTSSHPGSGGTMVYPECSPSLTSSHLGSGGAMVYPSLTSCHHTDVNSFALPPPAPPAFPADNSNSRGTIIYPEFVDHLIHPNVDSFKDIPKLPGQTDPRGRYM